jgi:hypothetical protein
MRATLSRALESLPARSTGTYTARPTRVDRAGLSAADQDAVRVTWERPVAPTSDSVKKPRLDRVGGDIRVIWVDLSPRGRGPLATRP